MEGRRGRGKSGRRRGTGVVVVSCADAAGDGATDGARGDLANDTGGGSRGSVSHPLGVGLAPVAYGGQASIVACDACICGRGLGLCRQAGRGEWESGCWDGERRFARC